MRIGFRLCYFFGSDVAKFCPCPPMKLFRPASGFTEADMADVLRSFCVKCWFGDKAMLILALFGCWYFTYVYSTKV